VSIISVMLMRFKGTVRQDFKKIKNTSDVDGDREVFSL
jgi:hypothetical protein